MGEQLRPVSFKQLLNWILEEYRTTSTIFGIHENDFYRNTTNNVTELTSSTISNGIGPAAGPNSQMTQNIIAAYLTGSRVFELKTVQIMNGEELQKCVPRPCIKAEDECFNVEWSTELTITQAHAEYVKAWFLIHILANEFKLAPEGVFCDFIFNISVGYDFAGITTEEMNDFIDLLIDASPSTIFLECKTYLMQHFDQLHNLTYDDVQNISDRILKSITLSTLHGCPPEEIEKIATYLIEEKRLNTYVKCNPTLLGYEFARNTLDDLGYSYSFDDHHFKSDLQYEDAIPMFKRLIGRASKKNVIFGVKITNTFPVRITANELQGEEMYMSGRSLFPLSISLASKLSKDFHGYLPISYSGGADIFNLEDILKTGIFPVTFATTILKPGGYHRINELAKIAHDNLSYAYTGKTRVKHINIKALDELADNVLNSKYNKKDYRTYGGRKTNSKLPLFDCYKSPCNDLGFLNDACPIEQKIPQYLNLLHENKYDEAFKIIEVDNPCPSVTGTLCNHKCQSKCTRLDYETPVEIRKAKKEICDKSQNDFLKNIKQAKIKSDKKVVIVGAGPAGISCASFLQRCGIETTVIEKRDKPMGIVRYVIPKFRIDDNSLDLDYKMAEKYGVNFIFNKEFTGSINDLKSEFNADYVVIATGSWLAGNSTVKAENNANIIDALEFLEKSKENNCTLDLGKTVAIIGAGDVAMDCGRTAIKTKNVDKAVIVYRRTREFMPALHEEINLALSDNVKIMELLSPISYDGKTLICEEMELSDFDASGRRSVVSTGKNVNLSFDTVISAVGSNVDTSIFTSNNMELEKWDFPKLNEYNETSIKNVYVSGDCMKGPSTIVNGIASSKKIAFDILTKENLPIDFTFNGESPIKNPELTSHRLSELFHKKGELKETGSDRCLSCNELCGLCVDVCPNRANMYLDLSSIKQDFKDIYQILHIDGFCNECGNCTVFCPHSGRPYEDKLTLFCNEDDFYNSTNKGFLFIMKECVKVRNENGEVTDYENASELFKEIINFTKEKFDYMLIDPTILL